MEPIKIVCILGRAGSGKSTCGKRCAELIPTLAFLEVGGEIRRLLKEHRLPSHLQAIIDSGNIIPDKDSFGIVINFIEEKYKLGIRHFLIDGYPRSGEQIRLLIDKYGSENVSAVEFVADRDVAFNRLMNRKDERNDDHAEAISQRFRIFDSSRDEIVSLCPRLYQIDSNNVLDMVCDQFIAIVNNLF